MCAKHISCLSCKTNYQDFLTFTGSLLEDQNEVDSRLSGLLKRRVPMKWWRICSKGPRNMELSLWTAVGKGPEIPGNHLCETFFISFYVSYFVESVASFCCCCFSLSRPSSVEVTGLAQLLKSHHMLLERSKPPTNRM